MSELHRPNLVSKAQISNDGNVRMQTWVYHGTYGVRNVGLALLNGKDHSVLHFLCDVPDDLENVSADIINRATHNDKRSNGKYLKLVKVEFVSGPVVKAHPSLRTCAPVLSYVVRVCKPVN